MDFRNEWKHEINYLDLSVIRQRLSVIAKKDPHAAEGSYKIRSLYFDTPTDKALLEKINGVNKREKFRIRYYDSNTSVILLEKKSKYNGLCSKERVLLTREEAQMVAEGRYDWMMLSNSQLVKELYVKIRSQGLRPKTIVDYTREPFIYPYGNVRVTLDYNIRTGMGSTDFLNADCITVPAGKWHVILEVKWDAFLPSVIRDIVQMNGRQTTAFSKYAVCRIYG
jgi:SPX domain protein involved in polyphosphate accumulation